MKKAISFVLCLSVLFGCLCCGMTASAADAAELRFGADGKFTILQIADTQDTQKPISNLLTLIQRALDESKPDLVVFTGDQLKTYDSDFDGGNDYAKVEKAIAEILKPLERRGIPFAVVFGNHDADENEISVTKEEQMAIYMSHSGCLAVDEGDEVSGVGNYNLKILSSTSQKTAYSLYMFDTYDYQIVADQTEWYLKTSRALEEENGALVPSMCFGHVPVVDYYAAEPVSDFFKAAVERGDMKAMFFGHLHSDYEIRSNSGIAIGITPGVGFNEFGLGMERGVRVITLDENNTDGFDEELLTFVGLLGDNPITYCRYKLFTIGEMDGYGPAELVVNIIKWIGSALGYAFVQSRGNPVELLKTVLEFFGCDVGFMF